MVTDTCETRIRSRQIGQIWIRHNLHDTFEFFCLYILSVSLECVKLQSGTVFSYLSWLIETLLFRFICRVQSFSNNI